MTTTIAPRTVSLTDRRFFTGMALMMTATAFIGFAPTYYLAGLYDAPTLPLRVHIHGALCTAWMLLLVAQTGLIAAGRPDIHRLTGIAGAALAVAILVFGVVVALASERRVHTATTAGTLADPYVFVTFGLANVGMFAVFAAAGIANRGHPDVHKRLMLLATMSLLVPAVARIVSRAIPGVPGVLGALAAINVFLVAMVVYDLATRGRLYPATLWGGGLLLISQPTRVAIAFSEPWQAVARELMG